MFNLDGSYSWQFYWHDVRREEQIFFKRQERDGSVMVWTGFDKNLYRNC